MSFYCFSTTKVIHAQQKAVDCKTRGALGEILARRLREAAGEFLHCAQVARARICGARRLLMRTREASGYN